MAAVRDGWRTLVEKGPGQIQFWFIALIIGIAAGFAALLFRLGITLAADDALRHRRRPPHPQLRRDARLVLDPGDPDRGRAGRGPDPRPVHRRRAGALGGRRDRGRRAQGRPGRDEGGPRLGRGLAHHAVLGRLHRARGAGRAPRGRDLHLGVRTGSGRAGSPGATSWAARWRRRSRPPSTRPSPARSSRWRWCCATSPCTPSPPSSSPSVAGTVINRIEFGDVTEYTLPEGTLLGFYVELPAFLLLGLVSGLVAVAMMKAIFWAEDMGNRLQARPASPATCGRWLRGRCWAPSRSRSRTSSASATRRRPRRRGRPASSPRRWSSAS